MAVFTNQTVNMTVGQFECRVFKQCFGIYREIEVLQRFVIQIVIYCV
jgi:hypothetical protein